jgi:hypothetical protein
MFSDELARLVTPQPLDPPFVAMMANGASGDINNINFVEPRASKSAYEQMRYVAHDVAAKVFAAMKDVEYKSDIKLSAKYREPNVRWRHPSPATIAWAEAKLQEPETDSRRADLPRIYAKRALSLVDHPKEAPVPVQLLRIGDGVIGTMPFEVFCEIGLEFKKHFDGKPAILASLSHGYFGYLPSPAQHPLGGYETWLGTNRVEPETSDVLLKNLLEMASE